MEAKLIKYNHKKNPSLSTLTPEQIQNDNEDVLENRINDLNYHYGCSIKMIYGNQRLIKKQEQKEKQENVMNQQLDLYEGFQHPQLHQKQQQQQLEAKHQQLGAKQQQPEAKQQQPEAKQQQPWAKQQQPQAKQEQPQVKQQQPQVKQQQPQAKQQQQQQPKDQTLPLPQETDAFQHHQLHISTFCDKQNLLFFRHMEQYESELTNTPNDSVTSTPISSKSKYSTKPTLNKDESCVSHDSLVKFNEGQYDGEKSGLFKVNQVESKWNMEDKGEKNLADKASSKERKYPKGILKVGLQSRYSQNYQNQMYISKKLRSKFELIPKYDIPSPINSSDNHDISDISIQMSQKPH